MKSASLSSLVSLALGSIVLASCSQDRPEGDGWSSIFDARTGNDWIEAKFSQAGMVKVDGDEILLLPGAPFTGVVYSGNDFPKTDYEISLEARRIEGSDFFCGLTVPVGNSYCSLIVGGWAGRTVGISNIDDADASNNETTTNMEFETGKYYKIRMRVTESEIEAWIDDRRVASVNTEGRKVSLRAGEIYKCQPLGICSYFTKAGIRNVRYREL